MDKTNLYTMPISFKSRCVQVRDAQWVCHKVNTEMPYFSITKIKPLIIKQMNTLERHFPQREKTSIKTYYLWNNLKALGLNNEDLSQLSFYQRIFIKYKQKFFYTENDKHISVILNKAKDVIKNFNQKRNECKQYKNDVKASLIMLEKYKLGNCQETAILAELILKINGIKNAQTVILKAENENVTLDHEICVFNRDGSAFSKINRDTIVVDPWINKADFAANMIEYYKNQCKFLFRIPEGQKINFLPYKHNNLTKKDITQFCIKYPKFLFNSSKRKFMSNEAGFLNK